MLGHILSLVCFFFDQIFADLNQETLLVLDCILFRQNPAASVSTTLNTDVRVCVGKHVYVPQAIVIGTEPLR